MKQQKPPAASRPPDPAPGSDAGVQKQDEAWRMVPTVRADMEGASPMRPALPSRPTVEIGASIDGTYRVLRTLGEGGMGVVLLARDLHLERDVAIKLIRRDNCSQHQSHARFLAEARAMARVRHPNVVEVFAYGEAFGSPYFAMEYVPGPTLERWARDRGPSLPVDEVIGVLEQVCRGVSAIHATGALHRDIKPANILVGPAFRVVVADFGLSRVLGKNESGEHGALWGTPAYMAPELFSGETNDPSLEQRADVYALGVLAYELFTGKPPFYKDNLVALVHQICTEAPARPSQVRPELPTSFDAPILAALAKDPAERTPSVEALRRGLLEAREEVRLPSAGTTRILVADDDGDMRAFVLRILAKALPGASIEAVPDGASALDAATRTPPDAVVIDLDMPGLNGIELTAALRAQPGSEHTPIIVMTGSGTAADWRVLSGLGADGFLMKPFRPTQLSTLVRSLLHPSDAGQG